MQNIEFRDILLWEIFTKLLPIDLQNLRRTCKYFSSLIPTEKINLKTTKLELVHLKRWTSFYFPVNAVFHSLENLFWFLSNSKYKLIDYKIPIIRNASISVYLYCKKYMQFSSIDIGNLANENIIIYELHQNTFILLHDIISRDLLNAYKIYSRKPRKIIDLISQNGVKILNYELKKLNIIPDLFNTIITSILRKSHLALNVIIKHYLKNFHRYRSNIFESVYEFYKPMSNRDYDIDISVSFLQELFTFENFLEIEKHTNYYNPIISLVACKLHDLRFIYYLLDNNYSFHYFSLYYIVQLCDLPLFKRIGNLTKNYQVADITACYENNLPAIEYMVEKNVKFSQRALKFASSEALELIN